MKKDKDREPWSASADTSSARSGATRTPARQESGAEFKDDPKTGPSAGRRGGESRPATGTTAARPTESAAEPSETVTKWNGA